MYNGRVILEFLYLLYSGKFVVIVQVCILIYNYRQSQVSQYYSFLTIWTKFVLLSVFLNPVVLYNIHFSRGRICIVTLLVILLLVYCYNIHVSAIDYNSWRMYWKFWNFTIIILLTVYLFVMCVSLQRGQLYFFK